MDGGSGRFRAMMSPRPDPCRGVHCLFAQIFLVVSASSGSFVVCIPHAGTVSRGRRRLPGAVLPRAVCCLQVPFGKACSDKPGWCTGVLPPTLHREHASPRSMGEAWHRVIGTEAANQQFLICVNLRLTCFFFFQPLSRAYPAPSLHPPSPRLRRAGPSNPCLFLRIRKASASFDAEALLYKINSGPSFAARRRAAIPYGTRVC